MLTTAVCARGQTPKEQERVFPVMGEHSFLRLGFKGDHNKLSRIRFRLPQTTVTLSYGVTQIQPNTNQLLPQFGKFRAILKLFYGTRRVRKLKTQRS